MQSTTTSASAAVTQTGVGTSTINVGSDGQAFYVANNNTVTVFDLLLATKTKTSDGLLYDLDANDEINSLEKMLRTMANEVYTLSNEPGDI